MLSELLIYFTNLFKFKGGIKKLDLAFETKKIRSICENEEDAIKEFGKSLAKILIHRLSDLIAATSVKDLLVGHPEIIDYGGNNQVLSISLGANYLMYLQANHPINPKNVMGKIDWEKVSRVKILRIVRENVEL